MSISLPYKEVDIRVFLDFQIIFNIRASSFPKLVNEIWACYGVTSVIRCLGLNRGEADVIKGKRQKGSHSTLVEVNLWGVSAFLSRKGS